MWVMGGFAWLGVYFFLDRYLHEETQLWFGVFWICVIDLVVAGLRHFCHKLPLLLAGHIVLYGITILFAHETMYLKEERTIFCLLMLTGCMIGTIQLWRMGFGPMVYSIPWHLILEVLVLYFYGVYLGDSAYQTMAFVLTVIFLVGHFWCLYLQGMNHYLDQNMELEGIPRSSILRINTRVVAGILLMFFLIVLIAGMFQFDQFFGQIGGWIAGFFKMLILGIQYVVHTVQRWNHAGEGGNPDYGGTDMAIAMPETEPMDSDDGSIGYAAMGMLICLLVFFYLVHRLVRAFDDKDNRDWKRPDYGGYQRLDDQVESLKTERKKRFRLFRTNREKIRYQYKRRIKKWLKGHIPQGNTAWELTELVLRQQEEEGMEKLTELYDVARYGEREITLEEVRKVKEW